MQPQAADLYKGNQKEFQSKEIYSGLERKKTSGGGIRQSLVKGLGVTY